MKKITIITLAAVLFIGISASTNKAKAQAGSAFETGTVTITAGYGFPNLGKSIFKTYETYTGFNAFGLGPIHFKGEYGLSDNISFGLSVNYVSSGFEYTDDYYDGINTITYDYKLSYSSISFLGRMNLHFGVSDKLDPYWGVGAGYKVASWKWTTDDPFFDEGSFTFVPIPVGFETTIGLRYFFVDNVGAYVEMGIAKSLIQAGIAVKF